MSGVPWDVRLATPIARVLARTPITPNQVTTLGLFTGLGAAILFAQGERTLTNIAAFLYIFTVFNDHVDGELARITGKTSSFGHQYDHVVNAVSHIGLFLGAGIGLSHGPLGPWGIPLGLFTTALILAILGFRVHMEIRFAKSTHDQPGIAGFEIEDALYLVGPIAWLDGLLPFLVATALGAPIFLAWVIWDWRRTRDTAQTREYRR